MKKLIRNQTQRETTWDHEIYQELVEFVFNSTKTFGNVWVKHISIKLVIQQLNELVYKSISNISSDD